MRALYYYKLGGISLVLSKVIDVLLKSESFSDKLFKRILNKKAYHLYLWRKNIPSELYFWNRFFETKGLEWKDRFTERSNPNLPLQQDIYELVKDIGNHSIEILDVGSGPQTFIGKVLEGKSLTIYATDPLANEYIEIMKRHNIEPLIAPLNIQAEELLKYFNSQKFDLVIARNSLDHAFDPIKAIENMFEIVKIDCFVYIITRENEAITQNYSGLHQWNFCIENNKFHINSKSAKHNIHELLVNADISWELDSNDKWLKIRIKRIK